GIQANIQEAVKCFEKAIELNPKNMEAVCSLADIFKNGDEGISQDLEKAIDILKKGLLADSQNVMGWTMLGEIYLQRNTVHGSEKLAIEAFEEAVRFDPKMQALGTYFKLLSLYLFETKEVVKNDKRAFELADRLYRMYPGSPFLKICLGTLFRKG